jgi:hypothetical protein
MYVLMLSHYAGASFHELLVPEWTTRLRDVFFNWLRARIYALQNRVCN